MKMINKRRFVSLILLLLVLLVDKSKAAYSVWGIRRLITQQPLQNSPPQHIPPVPSPLPHEKELKTSPNAKNPLVSNDPEKSNPKSSTETNVKTPVAGPPIHVPVGSGNKDLKKGKDDGNANSKLGSKGSCEGSTKTCKLQKNLTACIQSLESESKGLVLFILNEGESPLKVNITMPTSLTNVVDEHLIPKKHTEKISVSSSVEQGSKILLKIGDEEECSLIIGTATIQSNFLQQIPSYYKQITPVYVAYFVFLVALIIGGACACCQLRKRKRQDGGVPYQELEMGISESASATNVETADGWDDGWDDDWDEDKAVKSPGHRPVGISANGLSARTSKQDGLGKDWDD